MRGVGQAVVSSQATACSIIRQRIDGRGSAATRVLGIKGADGAGGYFFRTNKTTYRSQRDAGRRVAVIGLVRGAAAVDCQSLFINRGTVRGISQAVVAGQTTVGAITQAVGERDIASTRIGIIVSTGC